MSALQETVPTLPAIDAVAEKSRWRSARAPALVLCALMVVIPLFVRTSSSFR